MKAEENGNSHRNGMQPCILHVDVDACFAQIEKLINPKLRGRPVAVGAGVCSTCCYVARRYGVKVAMPLSQARRLCPDLVVLRGHQKTYECFTRELWDICRDYSPAVETFLDEAYLDLTGTEHLYSDYEKVGRALKARVKHELGLEVTVGIAAGRMIAKMAGKETKPNGFQFIPFGTESDYIAGKPVEALAGVGHAIARTLHDCNIRTVSELRALPAATLERMFGVHGLLLYDRARGRDPQIVEPDRPPLSVSRSSSFYRDTADRVEIQAMLAYLCERAMRAVRGLGLKGRTVKVSISYSDGGGDAVSRSLPEATALDEDVFDLALALLDALYRRRASLHRVGICLSNFRPDSGEQQREIFSERDRIRLRRLHAAKDSIRARYGHASVVAGKSLTMLNDYEQNAYGFILRCANLTK